MTLQSSPADLVSRSADPLLASRWPRVELQRIAAIDTGYPFPSRYFNEEDGALIIRIRDLFSSGLKTRYSGPVPEGYWVETDDLLVGMDGEFRSVLWSGPPGLLNQRVARIRVNPRFYVQTFLAMILPGYLNLLSENTSSVTVKHLSTKALQTIPLPMPTVEEQREIMRRVGEFEASLDRLTVELDGAEESASKLENETLRRAFLSVGKPGWEMISLSEIAEIRSGIAIGRRYSLGDQLVERPYLRVANVQRGYLDLNDVRVLKLTGSEAERYRLLPGDVLLNEGGDRDKLGRGWVWEGQIPDCVHQNHVFRVRLKTERLTPKLLSRYANTIGAEYFFTQGKQTSNLASISADRVMGLQVPLPPKGAAAEIEAYLEEAERFLADVRRELTQARSLLLSFRRSVVISALRGLLSEKSVSGSAPLPTDDDVTRFLNRRPRATTSKEMIAMQTRTPLVSCVPGGGKSVSPEQLFARAGFKADEVEEFYRELRSAVDASYIAQTADFRLQLVDNASEPNAD
jgi:type I restriction enzyme S subunit